MHRNLDDGWMTEKSRTDFNRENRGADVGWQDLSGEQVVP